MEYGVLVPMYADEESTGRGVIIEGEKKDEQPTANAGGRLADVGRLGALSSVPIARLCDLAPAKAAPTQTVWLSKTAKDPKLCNLPNNGDRDLAGGLAGQAGFEE